MQESKEKSSLPHTRLAFAPDDPVYKARQNRLIDQVEPITCAMSLEPEAFKMDALALTSFLHKSLSNARDHLEEVVMAARLYAHNQNLPSDLMDFVTDDKIARLATLVHEIENLQTDIALFQHAEDQKTPLSALDDMAEDKRQSTVDALKNTFRVCSAPDVSFEYGVCKEVVSHSPTLWAHVTARGVFLKNKDKTLACAIASSVKEDTGIHALTAAFSPDGKTLCVSFGQMKCCSDKCSRLVFYDTETGDRTLTTEVPHNVYHMLYTPSGTHLWTDARHHGECVLLALGDGKKGAIFKAMKLPCGNLGNAAFRCPTDDLFLAAVHVDDMEKKKRLEIYMCDLKTDAGFVLQQCIDTPEVFSATLKMVKHPQAPGWLLIAANRYRNCAIQVWHLHLDDKLHLQASLANTFEPMNVDREHWQQGVHFVDVSHDERLLMYCTAWCVEIYDLKENCVVRNLPIPRTESCLFLPNKDMLLMTRDSVSGRGVVRLHCWQDESTRVLKSITATLGPEAEAAGSTSSSSSSHSS